MRIMWRLAAALGAALALWLATGGLAVADDSPRHHPVASGDTLWSIADLYHTSVDELVKLNDIKYPDLLLPGQIIKLPERDKPAQPGTIDYEVQPGDYLSKIAAKFDITTRALAEANEISDMQHIVPGQKLKVPGAALPPVEPTVQAATHPPDDPDVEKMFNELAGEQGLDPGMVKALAWLESGWRQHAVSPAGAIGFMQLMPTTAQWLKQAVIGGELHEDLSAYDNVRMGTRYLRLLLDATGGDKDKALASYYQGYGATMSGVMYEETKRYVELIKDTEARYWPE